MVKDILIGNEGKRKLNKGVQTLNNAVKVTMGAAGRTVLIDRGMFGVYSTKDGVSVAKEIDLKDPFENMGANAVLQAARQTALTAGDGTTTATVLASSMIDNGVRLLTNSTSWFYRLAFGDVKFNVTDIKRGMDECSKFISNELASKAIKINGDLDKMKAIATVSANGDEEIGDVVANAVFNVGEFGDVTISKTPSKNTEFTVSSGYRYEGGFYSEHFESKQGTGIAEYENAKVLIVDGAISDISDMMPILTRCKQENVPLVVLAENIHQNTLSALAKNNIDGVLKVLVGNLPDFGELRKMSIRDLTVASGAKLVSRELGVVLKDVSFDDLGSIEYIKCNATSTTIRFNSDKGDVLSKLAEDIRQSMDSLNQEEDAVQYSYLQKRLKRCSAGIVTIHIKADSELEFGEKFDRVEDAKHATLSALSEGVIQGGGLGLFEIASKFNYNTYNKENESFKVGVELVLTACTEPIKQILSNGGVEVTAVLSAIKKDKFARGFNIKTKKFVDFMEQGIIDPVKVTRTALLNATSVAGTLLTTEAVITPHNFEK